MKWMAAPLTFKLRSEPIEMPGQEGGGGSIKVGTGFC